MENVINKKGLFVGLCNLDMVYYSDSAMPRDNEKKKVTDYCFAVGGPAANAAITYRLMGGEAYLLCAVGQSAMGKMLKSMLEEFGVHVIDMAEDDTVQCNVSCIHVNTANGDRTILSGQSGIKIDDSNMEQLKNLTNQCEFALYDGNLYGVEDALVQYLRSAGKDLVLDCGSYKEGFPKCFAMKPTVISSENFGIPAVGDVFALNKQYSFVHSVQTRGAKPLRYEIEGKIKELSVRSAAAVDTLGAGDIFHGAYCYFKYVQNLPFAEALGCAADFASYTVEKRGVIAGIMYAKDRF